MIKQSTRIKYPWGGFLQGGRFYYRTPDLADLTEEAQNSGIRVADL